MAADDLRHLTEATAHGMPVYVWSAFLAGTRFRAKIAPWVARFGRGILSDHGVHTRCFEGRVEDHGERQCLERVAAPPWARNLKSYENVTSISSVGMVMERKRPKVLITFALTAAERAMCPAKWAAPLAPRSARELLLFCSSASWDIGRRAAAALPLKTGAATGELHHSRCAFS